MALSEHGHNAPKRFTISPGLDQHRGQNLETKIFQNVKKNKNRFTISLADFGIVFGFTEGSDDMKNRKNFMKMTKNWSDEA